MGKWFHKVVGLLLGIGLVLSCQSPTSSVRQSRSIVPSYIHKPEERLQYLIEHYWESTNLKDSSWLTRKEELRYKVEDYFSLLASSRSVSIQQLLFPLASLDGEVLIDVLGYYKNFYQSQPITAQKDAYYSHVLIWAIRSPKVPAHLQKEARVELRHILKNKVGSLATNFEYRRDSLSLTLDSGNKAKYRLLFLCQPDSGGRASIYNTLRTKPIYKHLVDKRLLRTTMINLGASTIKADSLCPQWLEQGIDEIDTIRRYALYDVGREYSIYLLDQQRKVVLKNPQWEELTKYLEEYGKR